MKKYVLTSPMFEGAVTFGYSDDGWLTYLQNEANFNDKQYAWLFDEIRFPKRLEQVTKLTVIIKGSLEELPEDISFERFWDIYDKKVNLKRSKPLYNALSNEDKLMAIIRVKHYFKYCQRTGYRGIADPDKYLRNRYFETDWNKER